MILRVDELIQHLQLLPHPEGGFYKETYRSDASFSGAADFPQARSYDTGIYFLLYEKLYSSFHRIRSDEMWHHYEGEPLEVIEISPNGELSITELGKGGVYQHVVKAGVWFASRVKNGDGYALVGCTVSPGFDFQDFELAGTELLEEFPKHSAVIKSLLIQ